MPYRWNMQQDSQSATRILELWPHNSLPKQGFAGFILITFALILIPLLALTGTIIFWGLLPFMMMALWGIWVALQKSYRNNQIFERLQIGTTRLELTRTDSSGDVQSWECEGYWSRVQLYHTEGPVPNYVTLNGNGREVEIGAFLSEDERKLLYNELRSALALYKD